MKMNIFNQWQFDTKEEAEQEAERIAEYAEELCRSIEYCRDCECGKCVGKPTLAIDWIEQAKSELGYD